MFRIDLLTPARAQRNGREPERNAFVELHNVIVSARSLADFGPSDRDRIGRQRGVDLQHAFLDDRRGLYQQVLKRRLSDDDLDQDDRAILAHLAETLALSTADLRPVHERAFGEVVLDAIADDCLSIEERLLVLKLQHTLGLDPRVADGAYDVLARERLLKTVARALCDGSLSPEEEAEIEATAQALSTEVPVDIRTMLDAARTRWKLRSGTVGADVALKLGAGEDGRFEAPAAWRFAHAGRLAEWAGYAAVQSGRTSGLLIPPSVLRGAERSGTVSVTSRRLVLTPTHGLPDEIKLDAIAQTLRFRNGTIVRLHNERRYFVDAGDGRDAFYSHLYYAVEDHGRPPD